MYLWVPLHERWIFLRKRPIPFDWIIAVVVIVPVRSKGVPNSRRFASHVKNCQPSDDHMRLTSYNDIVVLTWLTISILCVIIIIHITKILIFFFFNLFRSINVCTVVSQWLMFDHPQLFKLEDRSARYVYLNQFVLLAKTVQSCPGPLNLEINL
jgi:hypothetical protein